MMNYEVACSYLDLNPDIPISPEQLKKQYRIKALTYHPDKNKSPDSVERFQKIQESYEFLSRDNLFHDLDEANETDGDDYSNYMNFDSVGEGTYNTLLMSFVSGFMNNDMNPIFRIILQKIAGKCEQRVIDILEKLDKQLLLKINSILKKYQGAFHLSNSFFDKIDEMCSDKIRHDECIILNPLLNDLYNDNLYKLTVDSRDYVVPLWHHELTYDSGGKGSSDIYVHCYPVLPEHISIDNKNNISVQLKYKISDIWNCPVINVQICSKKAVSFQPKELRLQNKQTITMAREGISRINTVDIFDITKRSDVILHIELEP
jgi:hypothetical protein